MKRSANAKTNNLFSYFEPRTRVLLSIALVATIASGAIDLLNIGGHGVLLFLVSAVALAVLAALVGEGTDQVGSHLGPGATGVLQSALGNLPELFVAIFASALGCWQWFRRL